MPRPLKSKLKRSLYFSNTLNNNILNCNWWKSLNFLANKCEQGNLGARQPRYKLAGETAIRKVSNIFDTVDKILG